MDDSTTRNNIVNINELRKNYKFTDAVLITKDNTSIHIHRNILASISTYFDNLFEQVESNVINMDIDITGNLLNIIIDFIYTGIIDITYENGKDLHKYAKILCIKNLEKSAEQLLIDNLNDETCLDYWRHAVEIKNENLIHKSFDYIINNIEDFFYHNLIDLTFQELEDIVSDDKVSCTQEVLYKNIVLWIKEDYPRRHNYLKEFFRYFKISGFSISFITSEILSEKQFIENNDLPDETLKYFKDCVENPVPYNDLLEMSFECINNNLQLANFVEVLKNVLDVNEKHMNTYFQQANESTEMANNIKAYNEQIFNEKPKNEKIINFGKTYAYEFDFTNKILSPISKINQSVFFAVSAFKTENILISGGGYFFGTKNCKLFTTSTKKLHKISSMYERRTCHRSINLNNEQIYVCGGNFNNKSVEYYDIGSETWVKCLNSMKQKTTDFGLINHGHCLYTFGGIDSNNIELFDSRVGNWLNLQKNSDLTGLTRATCINDTVYCFGKKFGKIYDIRQNNWIERIIYPNNGQISWSYFDVIESNNLIYVFGYSFSNDETIYAYDFEEKIWTLLDMKIPKIDGTEFNLIKLIGFNSTENDHVNSEVPSTSPITSEEYIWNVFKQDPNQKFDTTKQIIFEPTLHNEKLMFISPYWIYNLNFITKTLDPIIKNYRPFLFSTCEFNKNCILISGGLFEVNSNLCKYYCDLTQTIKDFPSLIDQRIYHKTIALHDKIYACGGLMNNKFCEIFEQTSETWKRSTERMIDKLYDFGITIFGECIYTFGGFKDTSTTLSDTVERFDPRVGKWINLKSDSNKMDMAKCLTFKNTIYCFERHFLYIFDVRKNQWLPPIFHSSEIFINFCVGEVDGKILLVGQLEEGKNCIKIFNPEDNTLVKIDFDVSEIQLHNMNLIKLFNN